MSELFTSIAAPHRAEARAFAPASKIVTPKPSTRFSNRTWLRVQGAEGACKAVSVAYRIGRGMEAEELTKQIEALKQFTRHLEGLRDGLTKGGE